MTLRHRTVQRSTDCEIHHWTGGPGDQSPIVLTHGATLDHRTWEPQAEAFAARCRILLWDVRDHGSSDFFDSTVLRFPAEHGLDSPED